MPRWFGYAFSKYTINLVPKWMDKIKEIQGTLSTGASVDYCRNCHLPTVTAIHRLSWTVLEKKGSSLRGFFPIKQKLGGFRLTFTLSHQFPKIFFCLTLTTSSSTEFLILIHICSANGEQTVQLAGLWSPMEEASCRSKSPGI